MTSFNYCQKMCSQTRNSSAKAFNNRSRNKNLKPKKSRGCQFDPPPPPPSLKASGVKHYQSKSTYTNRCKTKLALTSFLLLLSLKYIYFTVNSLISPISSPLEGIPIREGGRGGGGTYLKFFDRQRHNYTMSMEFEMLRSFNNNYKLLRYITNL